MNWLDIPEKASLKNPITRYFHGVVGNSVYIAALKPLKIKIVYALSIEKNSVAGSPAIHLQTKNKAGPD